MPHGDSGSSGRTEVSEASRLLKLPLKHFTVVEKGRRKEEGREGGRQRAGRRERGRVLGPPTQNVWLRGK